MGQTRSDDRFELALVGAGRMGRTHLRALAAAGSVRVGRVVEPDATIRAELTAAGLRCYPSWAELMSEGAPDGALIATPTDQHLAMVRAVVTAGVPVLCEKPAGLTVEQIRAAGALAAEHGVPLQVAYWRRYVPALLRLRERIQDGSLGEIHLVIGWQWDERPPPARFRASSGGIAVDMGVHEFDQIRWLTGHEVVAVDAVAAGHVSDPEVVGDVDSATITLRLADGTAGLASLGRHYPGGDLVAAEVFGTRGHERIAFLDPGTGEAPLLDALVRQAEGFADLVRSGSRTGAGVDDAVAALAVAEQATRAIGLPANRHGRQAASGSALGSRTADTR